MKFRLMSLVFIGFITACGSAKLPNIPLPTNPKAAPPVGVADEAGVVIQSRAQFEITSNPSRSQYLLHELVLDINQPISITNGAYSSMTVDNSLFTVPVISSTLVDFGYLQITALKDNNLAVCGTNGTTQCTTAFIRMYTTGTAGAGLYNSVGGYGAPITAGQTTLSTVGLNAAGAAIMQSFAIPSTTHVLNLSNFVNPKYDVKVDFSNAGAGAYSTTLVIEYGLSL